MNERFFWYPTNPTTVRVRQLYKIFLPPFGFQGLAPMQKYDTTRRGEDAAAVLNRATLGLNLFDG